MKQDKIFNIETKIAVDYYFIKPFEIVSTYLSFVDTWKVANKVTKEIDEVKDVYLLQSLSDMSKYGFISYSKWESKESFKTSVENNVVLKYHNELNGNSTKSASVYLYKLASNEILNNRDKLKSVFQVYIFETDSSNDAGVDDYWKNKLTNSNDDVQSMTLFKSIYKNSKYRYIGFVYYNNIDDTIRESVLFEAQKGFNVFSSFFQIIKKF